MMKSSLVADSVTTYFGDRQILNGVFLKIGEGEIVGMVGLNGCGKSTLIRIISGELRLHSGTIRIDGEYCAPKNRWRHIAVLPQHNFLPRQKSVIGASRLYAGPAGKAIVLADSRTRSLIHQKVGDLSGGERRYVEFLLTLSLRRTHVLLDEPFSEMEPIYIERMSAAIREHINTGFLITDHRLHDVRNVSTRLISLADGHATLAKSTDAAFQQTGYLPSK